MSVRLLNCGCTEQVKSTDMDKFQTIGGTTDSLGPNGEAIGGPNSNTTASEPAKESPFNWGAIVTVVIGGVLTSILMKLIFGKL